MDPQDAKSTDLATLATETRVVGDLTELIRERRRFATVYADPPWPYQNQGTRGATGRHYATMTVDDIIAMPVPSLVDDAAHLHLWSTNAFLFAARRVMDAWEFVFKSTLVWVKPTIGLGNYWRCSHEILLTGTRGKLPFRDHSQPSWVLHPRQGHSQKPEAVRGMIERVSPGPYLELFGRRKVDGWTVHGDQIDPQEVLPFGPCVA